jgi:phosphatidylinositol glycan class A protein
MSDIIRALSRGIETIKAGRHDPVKAHERVKGMYAWSDVAERTEAVYSNAMASPRKDTYERLSRYVPLLHGIISMRT